MEKRIYLGCFISALLMIQSAAFAQKGSLMLYGSLNYRDNSQVKQFSTNPIGLGYFFNDHIVAGLNYGSDWQQDSERHLLQNRHEAGVFYSDSWALGKYFVFIAQLDLHGTWGKQPLGDPAGLSSYHGYLGRLYPIVAINLGHGWALKAKFAELSYEHIKAKNEGIRGGHNLITGVNGATFGVGVSKNIALHHHKS